MELDNLQKFNALKEIADDYKKDRPLENEIYLRDKLLGNKEKIRKPIKPQLFPNWARLLFAIIGLFSFFSLAFSITSSIGTTATVVEEETGEMISVNSMVGFTLFPIIITPIIILFILSMFLENRSKFFEIYLGIFEWIGLTACIFLVWYIIPLIAALSFNNAFNTLIYIAIGFASFGTILTLIFLIYKTILNSENRKRFKEDKVIFLSQKSTCYSSLSENLKFADIQKEEMTDKELKQLIFSYYPELERYLKKVDLNNIEEKTSIKICNILFDEIMNFEIELQKRQKRRIKRFKKYVSRQYFVDVMEYDRAESEILLNCITNKYKQEMKGFEEAYNEVESNYYDEIKEYSRQQLEDISSICISNEEKAKYPSVYVDYLVKANEENLNSLTQNLLETGNLLSGEYFEQEEENVDETSNEAEQNFLPEKLESLVWDTLDDDIRKHYINAQIKSLYTEQLAQENNLTREIRAIRKESLLSNEFYIEDLTKTEKTKVLKEAKIEFEKDKDRYMTLAVKELYTKQLKDDQKHSTLTREQRAIKRECLDLNEFPLEDLNEEEKSLVTHEALISFYKLFNKNIYKEKKSNNSTKMNYNKNNSKKKSADFKSSPRYKFELARNILGIFSLIAAIVIVITGFFESLKILQDILSFITPFTFVAFICVCSYMRNYCPHCGTRFITADYKALGTSQEIKRDYVGGPFKNIKKYSNSGRITQYDDGSMWSENIENYERFVAVLQCPKCGRTKVYKGRRKI